MSKNMIANSFRLCLLVLIAGPSQIMAAARPDPNVDQLESRIWGHWTTDVPKTLALAKNDNRKLEPGEDVLLPQFTFEFRRGKMIQHGFGQRQIHTYLVKARDNATGTLTLLMTSAGVTKQSKLTLNGRLLILESDGMKVALNRIKEDEAQERLRKHQVPREVLAVENAGNEAEAADPAKNVRWQKDATEASIPDKPVRGMANGVAFKVQKATLQRDTLILRQGEGFFADQEFQINLAKKFTKPYDGKSLKVKPGAGIGGTSIWLKLKEEGKDLPKTEMIHEGFTMQLVFGQSHNGSIRGKIYLCLPDKKSFIAGTFEAELK